MAVGQLPVADKLALCQQLFDDVKLPMIVRVTPMSQPRNLDGMLEAAGLRAFDDTRVMVHPDLSALQPEPLDSDVLLQRVGHAAFAQVVGQLRGSSLAQQQSHAQRLELSPVPFEGWVLRRHGESMVLACGQTAIEADMVGLYDVFTASPVRNQGWARKLCSKLLHVSCEKGARTGYLQVDAGNLAARSVYRRLGFADGYAYHYRTSADAVD
jgi:ribosomal protein S18 acetylase RimI-like enzyme